MHYDYVAIPDADVPQAAEAVFQHVVTTYASEVNKTVGVWRAVPDDQFPGPIKKPMSNEWTTPEHALAYLQRADRIPHRTEGEATLLEEDASDQLLDVETQLQWLREIGFETARGWLTRRKKKSA
jgi:hypothetical protein